MLESARGRAPTTNPILTSAALVGGVSFLIGFIGPALLSDSNLGPMLGIFVMGPLGALLGALIGILISASRKAPLTAATEVRWLAGTWIGAMLFSLASTIGGIGWLSIGAQLTVLACAAVLFYFMSARMPQIVQNSRPIILLGGALVLVTSIFPPVNSASGGHARFALFLDERFDASTQVPEYTVDATNLLLSWLIIAAAVLIVAAARRGSTTQPPL